MSVTIDTPDGTRYVAATIVMKTELDVLEWAAGKGVTPYFLPNEADATTILADCYDRDGLVRLSACAAVTR